LQSFCLLVVVAVAATFQLAVVVRVALSTTQRGLQLGAHNTALPLAVAAALTGKAQTVPLQVQQLQAVATADLQLLGFRAVQVVAVLDTRAAVLQLE
jgi:hypothetical protein